MSKNVLQKTKTAVGGFSILLPHNGLVLHVMVLIKYYQERLDMLPNI